MVWLVISTALVPRGKRANGSIYTWSCSYHNPPVSSILSPILIALMCRDPFSLEDKCFLLIPSAGLPI